jgi:hypothetical protein
MKMPTELELLIAFVFKSRGEAELTSSEIYMDLSFEYGWFPPAQAKEVIELAIKKGLLKRSEQAISPTFDYKSIQIPLGFKPSSSIFEQPNDIFIKLVNQIQERGIKREEAFSKINELRGRLRIIPEVAALLLAYSYGVDISDFIPKIERLIQEQR